MINKQNVKYALIYASFLHDIGKISQRIGVSSIYKDNETIKSLLTRGYGYLHALFTQEFFDRKIASHSIEEVFHQFGFPLENGGAEDHVANLASRHHNPQSPFQWLIAKADRLSSGHDRETKENDVQDELSGNQKYRKVRLQPIYPLIGLTEKNSEESYYEIKYFTGNSREDRFPVKKNRLNPKFGDLLGSEYKKVYDSFCKQFEQKIIPLLEDKNNEESTLLQFITLCERHFYSIPSSTIDLPDINLYDHCYLISSIAVALYMYHIETNTFTIDEIKNDDVNKFLLIQGDLSGIQSYILRFKQEAVSGLSKTLRARSFYLQLITKNIEQKILKELELPPTSVIMSAGSKFQILATNLPRVKDVIQKIQKETDTWLLEKYYGEISFQIDASIDFSPSDLYVSGQGKGFQEVLKRSAEALDKKKSMKFQSILKSDKGWESENFIFRESYEKFYLKYGGCAIREDFPAEMITNERNEEEKLSRQAYRERITGGELTHSRFITFDGDGEKKLPFSDFKFKKDSNSYRLIQSNDDLYPSLSYIGHLPKFTITEEEKFSKNHCLRCTEYKDDTCEIKIEFKAKSFHCLAAESERENTKTKEYTGKHFLGILKADVDRLGEVFSKGFQSKNEKGKSFLSISRYSSLSRNLNYFFTEYLNECLQKEEYRSIYTVYSGGDDLFLLGPYPVVLKFAKFFYEEFRAYTGNDPNLTFSAGFSLQKPRAPISIGARKAEEELEIAKRKTVEDQHSGQVIRGKKNSISLFGVKLSWNDFFDVLEIYEKTIKYIDEETISTAMIYRLLRYVRMFKNKSQNPMNVIYNSYFKYDLARNIYAKISEKDKNPSNKKMELAKYLEELFSSNNLKENRVVLEYLDVALQLAMYASRGGKG